MYKKQISGCVSFTSSLPVVWTCAMEFIVKGVILISMLDE